MLERVTRLNEEKQALDCGRLLGTNVLSSIFKLSLKVSSWTVEEVIYCSVLKKLWKKNVLATIPICGGPPNASLGYKKSYENCEIKAAACDCLVLLCLLFLASEYETPHDCLYNGNTIPSFSAKTYLMSPNTIASSYELIEKMKKGIASVQTLRKKMILSRWCFTYRQIFLQCSVQAEKLSSTKQCLIISEGLCSGPWEGHT